jgi:hypothetical protein
LDSHHRGADFFGIERQGAIDPGRDRGKATTKFVAVIAVGVDRQICISLLALSRSGLGSAPRRIAPVPIERLDQLELEPEQSRRICSLNH